MADGLMEMEATDLGEALETEVEETPDAEVPEDEGAEAEDSEEVEGEETEGAPEEEDKPAEPVIPDGRKMPDAVKKGLAALKTSNPEAAKTFRAQWFQNQDYKAAFATPAEAIALKQQLEDIGGADGVAQIQSERQEWGEVDKAVSEGRAAELLAHDPELLVKNSVGVINEFAKTAPEQYRFYADQVTLNTIQQTGVPQMLSEAYSSLGAFIQQNPELKNYIEPFQQKIAGAYNKIAEISERAQKFQQNRTDPREEALKQKEGEFETRRRADFEGQVATEAESYRDKEIDRAITALLNGRKADEDQMKHYRRLVKDEVGSRLAQVPNFDAQLDAQYRTGDRGKSVNYVKQQFDRILGPGKAANVIEPLLRNINPAKAASKSTDKPRAVSEAGVITLNEMPNWNEVDWSKTTSAEYASGSATLTNGKKAKGWG